MSTSESDKAHREERGSAAGRGTKQTIRPYDEKLFLRTTPVRNRLAFGQRAVDQPVADRDDLGLRSKRSKGTHRASPVVRSSESVSVLQKWQNPPTAGGFAFDRGSDSSLQIPPRMHAGSNRRSCCCWARCVRSKNIFTKMLTRHSNLSRDKSQATVAEGRRPWARSPAIRLSDVYQEWSGPEV